MRFFVRQFGYCSTQNNDQTDYSRNPLVTPLNVSKRKGGPCEK